jgi:hypothetical protein
MLIPVYKNKFAKDIKRLKKRGKSMDKLKFILGRDAQLGRLLFDWQRKRLFSPQKEAPDPDVPIILLQRHERDARVGRLYTTPKITI